VNRKVIQKSGLFFPMGLPSLQSFILLDLF
jgi:hypothetical protein